MSKDSYNVSLNSYDLVILEQISKWPRSIFAYLWHLPLLKEDLALDLLRQT
jgi:hypothetical protein